jgi:hypothetical protein
MTAVEGLGFAPYRMGDADLGDMHRILPVVFPVESIFPGHQCALVGEPINIFSDVDFGKVTSLFSS